MSDSGTRTAGYITRRQAPTVVTVMFLAFALRMALYAAGVHVHDDQRALSLLLPAGWALAALLVLRYRRLDGLASYLFAASAIAWVVWAVGAGAAPPA